MSFYLQYTYQYSFITVVKVGWSPRILNYFVQTQTIALCVFGLLAGIIMAWTKRLKFLLVAGLCIRLIGVGLMIKSKGALGSDALLVFGQVLQGVGGGFAAVVSQVAAQARVSHVDVAVVTALVLLITEVGNSVGSAIATAYVLPLPPPEEAAADPPFLLTLQCLDQRDAPGSRPIRPWKQRYPQRPALRFDLHHRLVRPSPCVPSPL